MKHAFRWGLVLIPFLFFVSTTAYPSDYSLVERNLITPSSSRSLASGDANGRSIRLSALSPLVAHNDVPSTAPISLVSDMKPSSPTMSRFIGVEAPIFYFK